MAWVKFVREGVEIEVEYGTSVLEAEIQAGLRPDAPCGGLGKCGRCLAAFDIGTTTIAGYVLDGGDGRTLAVESRMNPQAQYGADVIMRANYGLEHGTEALSMCVRD